MNAPHPDRLLPASQPIETDVSRDPYSAWETPSIERDEPCRLISLFAQVHKFDEHAFLQDAYGRERFYWSEPGPADEQVVIAGVGIAAEARVAPILDTDFLPDRKPGFRFLEIARQARQLFNNALILPAADDWDNPVNGDWSKHPARPRLFGGFAFQDDFVPDNTWSVFSPAQFVLPHYQYVRSGSEAFLTINALLSPEDKVEDSITGLREALLARMETTFAFDHRPISPTDICYPMSPVAWREIVDRATAEIKGGAMKKVVLSRVCEVRTGEPIDAAGLLGYLDSRYGDSYRFIFEPTPHHAFFGATPELLVRKTNNLVQTMALAGSAARGQSPDQDEDNAQKLISSAKNRYEHQLVVDTIRQQLDEQVADMIVPQQPVMLRLRNIQHLLTPIEGRLRNTDTGVLKLVRQLHPTPAMGGVPADRALAFLRRAEPVPRGWYAAPIGWLDAHGDGVFAVAIRSAVSQYARAWLYAGAGIVGDSRPDREWAETALKFRPMLGALGIKEAA